MKILALLLVSLSIIQIKGDNASKIVEFAQSKVGCGYVWGATGQILTESKLKAFARNEHVDYNICKKWIGKQVFDCAGLVRAAFEKIGIQLLKGATLQWNQRNFWEQKGKISTLPKDKVCVLYKGDGRHMEHTGIYIKNGEYIHAGGSKTGVTKQNMSGSKWTHWAIPKGLYPPPKPKEMCTSFPCKAKVVNASSGKVNVRKGPSKGQGLVTKIRNGEIVDVSSGENGWYKISYGKFNGYIMGDFLEKA